MAAPAPVRALLLDITGTLINFKQPMGVVYRQCAENVQIPALPSADTFQTNFRRAYKEQWKAYPCYGSRQNMDERTWWRETAKNTLLASTAHVRSEQLEAFLTSVYNHYGSADAYTIYPDALPLLQYARTEGLTVGVLTNSSQRAITILQDLGLSVDCWASSQSIGHAKPSKHAFEHMFASLQAHDALKARTADTADGLKLANVLHVGDHPQEDFQGALDAGMQAMLLDRPNGRTLEHVIERLRLERQ